MGALFDSIELFMLLQLIKGLPLLFNHVSMCEREEIEALNLLHLILVVFPLMLLVKQDLICSDKGIRLVSLVLLLVFPLVSYSFVSLIIAAIALLRRYRRFMLASHIETIANSQEF